VKSITNTVKWKPSRYSFFFGGEDGTLLAFSSASKAVGRFSRENQATVKAILKSPGDAAMQFPSGLKIKKYLVKNGFLIPAATDEYEQLKVRNREGIPSRECFDLILIPTLDCNFRCFYCFEEHRPEVMPREVVERLVLWGEKNIPRYGNISLSWFGGEPLLELDTVLRLSESLRAICQRHSVGFHNMITTNGFGLHQDVVTSLLDAGICAVNVTMDGPALWHERFRRHRDGEKTFDRIVQGIVRVTESASDARIDLRINYDSRNFDSIPDLFHVFPTEIRGRMFVMLRQIFGDRTEGHPLPDKTRREKEIYSVAAQQGYRMSLMETLLGRKETFCYADKESSMVVNPFGDLYKCSLSKFTRESRVGRLGEKGEVEWDEERMVRWKSVDGFDDPVCRECIYLPLCMGGCRSQRVDGHVPQECEQPFEHLDLAVKLLCGLRGEAA